MLATQVQYWTLQETKRHNVEQEVLGYVTLNESVRHNLATESETQRHNIGQEQYWNESVAETSRHNVAQEDYWNNSLAETQRHNYALEDLQSQSVEIDRMNAYTNQINAATNRMNAMTNQANAVTQRANVEYNYDIGLRNVGIGEMNASTNRYNAQASYSLGMRANDISAMNAETNSRNADINWLNYTNSVKQTGARSRSVNVEETNALTNIQKTDIEQQKLDLGYSNLDLQRETFRWQQVKDLGDYLIKVVDQGNKIYSNVLKQYSYGGN